MPIQASAEFILPIHGACTYAYFNGDGRPLEISEFCEILRHYINSSAQTQESGWRCERIVFSDSSLQNDRNVSFRLSFTYTEEGTDAVSIESVSQLLRPVASIITHSLDCWQPSKRLEVTVLCTAA